MSGWRDRTCGECQFWRCGGGDTGACFKKPPVAMAFSEMGQAPAFDNGKLIMKPTQTITIKAVYPPMGRDNHACGDFDEADMVERLDEITRNKQVAN